MMQNSLEPRRQDCRNKLKSHMLGGGELKKKQKKHHYVETVYFD